MRHDSLLQYYYFLPKKRVYVNRICYENAKNNDLIILNFKKIIKISEINTQYYELFGNLGNNGPTLINLSRRNQAGEDSVPA